MVCWKKHQLSFDLDGMNGGRLGLSMGDTQRRSKISSCRLGRNCCRVASSAGSSRNLEEGGERDR